MPAQLRVYTSSSPPLCAWIQSEVIRLGSGENCDIQVAGLAPHLATIVFREGAFLLVNRSSESATLGGKEVLPGAELVWEDLAVLRVTSGISIALVCHDNPAPVSDEPWRKMPNFEEPDIQRESAKRRRKELTCFIVSLVALFFTAVMWRQPVVSQSYSQYQQLASQVAGAPADLRAEFGDVLGWIQKAYSLEQRDDSVLARRAYLQAREVLIRIPERPETSQLQRRMLSLITTQIARI